MFYTSQKINLGTTGDCSLASKSLAAQDNDGPSTPLEIIGGPFSYFERVLKSKDGEITTGEIKPLLYWAVESTERMIVSLSQRALGGIHEGIRELGRSRPVLRL